jgi:hypothetical protein
MQEVYFMKANSCQLTPHPLDDGSGPQPDQHADDDPDDQFRQFIADRPRGDLRGIPAKQACEKDG